MSGRSRVPGPRGPTGAAGPTGPAGGGGSDNASLAYSTTEAANTAPTTGTDLMVATTGADFAADVTGADFAFTAAGCVWTYSGADATFLLDLRVSVYASNVAANNYVGAAIDHNGDAIGQSRPKAQGYQEADIDEPTVEAQLACMRIVTLSNGDTVQPAFCMLDADGTSSGLDCVFTALTFAVVPL